MCWQWGPKEGGEEEDEDEEEEEEVAQDLDMEKTVG
jgi:hypothetical protein